MNKKAPVEIKNIVNRFGDHLLHDGINLTIRPGEILSIVGGSGSGKTVLLNSMIGLHQPNEGQVELLGVPMMSASHQQRRALRHRIGVVFQAGALFSAFTVFENIGFPLEELHTLPKSLRRELTQLKIHMVGLASADGHKLPAELSGGMRTRAALARALALDPELLFLDEPTSGLDPVSAELFVSLISRLRSALDLTVVMVTHDLYTLTALSDRVAVLADKNIAALGTAQEVMSNPHPFIQSYFRTLREFPPAVGGSHGI